MIGEILDVIGCHQMTIMSCVNYISDEPILWQAKFYLLLTLIVVVISSISFGTFKICRILFGGVERNGDN